MVIKNSVSNNIRNILKLLNIAVILGIFLGLFIAALHILRNRYIDYEAYNIILLYLRAVLNRYLLIFILIALGVFIINTLTKRIFLTERLKRFIEKRPQQYIRLALSYSLVLISLLAVILFSKYPDIISFLKSTPLTKSLHRLTTSKNETIMIFIFIASVAGLILVILSTYILSKSNIVDTVHHRFIRIADSGITKSLGFALLAVVIMFNIFTFGYKKIYSPSGPNIVLISIDTLRSDHLGSYGYQRDTSPNIDKYAGKGILFENAHSQGPWTYPSMASMHTSLYPSQIGINNFDTKIHDSHMTLAEYMKNDFYNTYAVISNVVVSKPMGFSQGFDTFDQDYIRKFYEPSSHLVTERAIEYLREAKGDKFFLWLHYMDPHGAYLHHPEYGYSSTNSGTLEEHDVSPRYLNKNIPSIDEETLQYIKDLYDEEISFTDHHIGLVLDYLRESKLSENTIVIITADHGEEFLERGHFGHGNTLYEELIHVPLIIYVPSDKEIGPKKVKSSVEVRSIARTLLDLCGIRGKNIQGNNLLIAAEDDDSNSYVFSQKTKKNHHFETIIAGNWKLIKNLHLNTYQLYNLGNDPLEKTNLFESGENGLDRVKKELISRLSGIDKERIGEIEEVEFKEEDIQKLKALGYIQ